jgi:hypothetical protein
MVVESMATEEMGVRGVTKNVFKFIHVLAGL